MYKVYDVHSNVLREEGLKYYVAEGTIRAFCTSLDSAKLTCDALNGTSSHPSLDKKMYAYQVWHNFNGRTTTEPTVVNACSFSQEKGPDGLVSAIFYDDKDRPVAYLTNVEAILLESRPNKDEY